MAERREDRGRPRALAVVGTRPEVIKMAPVLRALEARSGEVDVRLVLTGQHTDLVGQALAAFELRPDADLGIMREGQSLYDVAAGCLQGLRSVVEGLEPDMILVQGDTASVFFGALTAFFERLPVGHVEAGLRSGDKWAPFPEEIFRRLTDVVGDHLFAPTPRAAENLRAEGVDEGRIHVTGNTVVDALERAAEVAGEPEDETLARIVAEGRPLVLLTAHRRESFGAPLREVFRAVRAVADGAEDVEVLYPVHPNPNVREAAGEVLAGHPRIHLTGPLGYLDLVRALREARLVMTDSGGIQEEAPTFGTPVLVLREVTERPEGVEAGVARLVGTDGERIREEALALIGDDEAHRAMARRANPYGDGRAGERIADVVVSALTGAGRRTDDWTGVGG